MAQGLAPPGSELASRVEHTLAIMQRWGYVPTLEALAADLLGGEVSKEGLLSDLTPSGGACIEDGFVYIKGNEELLMKSKLRAESNRRLNGSAMAIAKEFTLDLVRVCPFVDCVALSGSVASGGYGPGDDIDFDLFVRSGTRYICYLLATLIGLKYGWRYRHREMDSVHRTPFLPKVTCVNVVWSEDQTCPFVRKDEDLAFELLRCRVLFGGRRFRQVLEDNRWLRDHFPQPYTRPATQDLLIERNAVGRLLAVVGRSSGGLRILEALSRGLAWIIYHFVQWTRRGNPEALRHVAFLKRVKWPYEVFQD